MKKSKSAVSRRNRENSRHSTGPKTTAGLARSRQNAIKHGAFASSSILLADAGERKRFEMLLGGLRADYQPKTIIQLAAVEELAILLIRKRRLVLYEQVAIEDEARKLLVKEKIGKLSRFVRDEEMIKVVTDTAKREWEEMDDSRRATYWLRALLLTPQAMDRTIRYDTFLSRQIDRLLARLKTQK